MPSAAKISIDLAIVLLMTFSASLLKGFCEIAASTTRNVCSADSKNGTSSNLP